MPELAERGRQEGARQIGERAVVVLQQVAVLEGMEVDLRRHPPPPPGEVDSAVDRAGPRFVEHLPAPFLQPEAEFGVLPVRVEVVVQDAALDRRVLERRAQEQRRGAGAAEHPLGDRVLAVVDLVGAAVDVPPAPGQSHAAGVDDGLVGAPVGAPAGAPAFWPAVRRRRTLLRFRSQQPPRHRAHRPLPAREPPRALDQPLRVVRRRPGVRVQAQHPLGLRVARERARERPVQAAGEAGVLVEGDHLDREAGRPGVPAQRLHRAVAARVVDDDQPERGPLKLRQRLEEPRQVCRVVPGNGADSDHTGCAGLLTRCRRRRL